MSYGRMDDYAYTVFFYLLFAIYLALLSVTIGFKFSLIINLASVASCICSFV